MKYRVKTELPVGAESLKDKNGVAVPVSWLLPKVDTVIDGLLGEYDIAGQLQAGLMIDLVTDGESAKFFIPEAYLEFVGTDIAPTPAGLPVETLALPANVSTTAKIIPGISEFVIPQFSGYTIVGALTGVSFGVGVYWLVNGRSGSFTRLLVFCFVGGIAGIISGQVTSTIVKKL